MTQKVINANASNFKCQPNKNKDSCDYMYYAVAAGNCTLSQQYLLHISCPADYSLRMIGPIGLLTESGNEMSCLA